MKTRALALLALAGLSTGCVTSYSSRPPLSFQDFDYSSPEGKPWPLKRLGPARHRRRPWSGERAQVAYVELNPEGQQTVLFIHGLGSYLKFWRYQLDAFAAQGYRVIAVDLPGYGKSDKPSSFPYTMEAMADAVHELAQKLDAGKPILVGHSMGGQTTLSYAIRYPEDLKAAVLTSPAGFEKFSPKEKAWFKRVFSTSLIKGATEYGIWGSVRQSNFERWRPELNWLVEERVRVARSPSSTPMPTPTCARWTGWPTTTSCATASGASPSPRSSSTARTTASSPIPSSTGARRATSCPTATSTSPARRWWAWSAAATPSRWIARGVQHPGARVPEGAQSGGSRQP